MTSAYLTHQLERWTRPAAHLFVRPDWRRFAPRDQDDHPFAFYERKYRPDQPRVPAGSREGGQWTADGGGGGDEGETGDRSPRTAQTSRGDEGPGRSSSNDRGGHHFVPRSVVNSSGLSDEAKRVFENARTGHLYEPRSNQWDRGHREYNKAVQSALDNYLQRSSIKPENMTAAQADDFVREVRKSRAPQIRDFNLRMMRREILRHVRWRIGRE